MKRVRPAPRIKIIEKEKEEKTPLEGTEEKKLPDNIGTPKDLSLKVEEEPPEETEEEPDEEPENPEEPEEELTERDFEEEEEFLSEVPMQPESKSPKEKVLDEIVEKIEPIKEPEKEENGVEAPSHTSPESSDVKSPLTL